MGDADIDEGAVAVVMDMVQRKVSLSGTAIKAALVGKQEKPEFDVTAWADRIVKAHPDQIDAMIAALQAKRK